MHPMETAAGAIERLYADALSPAAREAFTVLWEGTSLDAERALLRAVMPYATDADVEAWCPHLPASRDPWERRGLLVQALDPGVMGMGTDPRHDFTLRPLVARVHAERQARLLRDGYADADKDALDAALEEGE